MGDANLADPLTKREGAVLREFTRPATLASIAKEMFISVNTLKTQTRSIYRKLDVAGRNEAVERARALGLIPATER